MKKSILLFVCLLCATFAFAQQKVQDVVYLKNGSVIRGTITELKPSESVAIQTADGSIFDPDMAAGTDAGGYAGSNYEEFEGGYAGSNYEELEGGYAGSSYEEFDGGYAGMNYEEFDN